MMKPIDLDDIKYICRSMMGVDWEPTFCDPPYYGDKGHWKDTLLMQQATLDILSTCQSKLEVMYLLGIAYYLATHAKRNLGEDCAKYYPYFYADYPGMKGAYCHKDEQKGIHIHEPWHGYRRGWGPSALLIIPQWKSPDKDIHHDFALFTANDNGGGPPWHLSDVIEIEGYAVHKQRRKQDEKRYAGLSYEVTIVREELTQPHDWFQVIDCDYGKDDPISPF